MIAAGDPQSGAVIAAKSAPRRWRASPLARWESVLVLLLLAICGANSAASPYFLDLQNLLDSTQSFSEKAIMTLGMTLVILGRDIDLSVASMVALCATVMGWLATHGVGTPGLLAASLLVGSTLGMCNGALVTGLGLPAIVVTIGTVSLFRGISHVVLGDGAYTEFPEGFDVLGNGYLFGVVPYELLVLLGLAAVFYVLLHRTRIGRNLYAYGQNPDAARYSGIDVDAHRFWFFTLNGTLSGLAAALLTSRIGAARPNMALGWDLEVIAVVVLGGIGISGGTGRMSGVILAIFVMGMLTFGLGLRNVPGIVMSIVVGGLLIVSVALPAVIKKNRRAARQRRSVKGNIRMNTKTELRYLEDRWDDTVARSLDELDSLRYRSNLLGSDLRITNFGGGNTSAKLTQPDPLDGSSQEVLWVKGSGGDLGSIQRQGFASVYLRKLHDLRQRYRGAAFESEMVELYSLCTFGKNPVATSIDTPLHGFLPFAHVDHLHPDWGIALAAAANGREALDDFNARFGHHLLWVPWQRPGFELAMVMRNAIESTPGCDGIVLAGHGLFTWADTSRACYLRSLAVIDHLGQLVHSRVTQKGSALFGGPRAAATRERRALAAEILPFIRGRVSARNRQIGHFSGAPEVLRFVSSRDAEPLAHLGTSCPDHFIRTKIRPLYVPWDPSVAPSELRPRFEAALTRYRDEYRSYYQAHADASSPALRDDNPSVVLIPGVGMLTFGKTKSEARIVSEFYTNAIHVMEGATALATGPAPAELPQAGLSAKTEAFAVHDNYVALPLSEAFGIEYWQLEEAKLRRQPPEKELSRHVVVVVGGGSGIGRATVLDAARRGAHVVVLDLNLEEAEATAQLARQHVGKEAAMAMAVDIRSRESIRLALREVVSTYGGIDILVNTAAIFPSSPTGQVDDAAWAVTFDVNVTANHRLAEEAASILREQGLEASIVLTSSANAVVPKRGSEAYDVSKAALSHLVRELATALAPKIRVNGVSPATVVIGSSMFGRDRVRASLDKYGLPYDDSATDDQLSALLAEFYARRALTRKSIHPDDCARAILFLAGPEARCTTGHLLPVDGGLTDAFLR